MTKKQIKPFLDYEGQIDNLEKIKGMKIEDPAYAIGKLQDISYYALIDGYKNLFYNPMTRKYYDGTRFEDVVALYEFDEKLRSLVFRHICHIEQKLHSLISYHFCDTYSELQDEYLNPNHYNYSKRNKRGIDKLINILEMEAKQNVEHPYVVYQRNTYGNVPLWVIMKTLTFGQMSKMYSFFDTGMQAKISMHYYGVSERGL